MNIIRRPSPVKPEPENDELPDGINHIDLATLKTLPHSRTDVRGVSLINVNLRCANLNEANLAYANLQGADLRDASLQGAKLKDVDLSGIDLCGIPREKIEQFVNDCRRSEKENPGRRNGKSKFNIGNLE